MFLEEIRQSLLRAPKLSARRGPWREALLSAMRQMAKRCLDSPEGNVDLFFTEAAFEATRQFIRKARTFEPKISEQDLFQALRNLWVIHSVQLLLDGPITLSPATFAYSMLYPWTDNYLDDPLVGAGAKTEFGHWLTSRLEGSEGGLSDSRAVQVGDLIGLIESDYPRDLYPEVYLSLQAIHNAQMASLRQQGPNEIVGTQQLLRVTFAKGGASVLADAYLIRGHLSTQEADFMFGYGVLLQLMDDLQDLPDDLVKKHSTMLTQCATRGTLDEVVSKLWCFVTNQLRCPRGFAAAQGVGITRLIQANCKLILLQAVARDSHFYTNGFLAKLESHSPFRFEFLREREKSFAEERKRVVSTVCRTHQIGSILELLD